MSRIRIRERRAEATGFDWTRAQEYELEHARSWLRGNEQLIGELLALARRRLAHDVILHELFGDDATAWRAFVAETEGKSLLDIGGGPLPTAVMWSWMTPRAVIDPLAASYERTVQELRGVSWFDNVRVHSHEAESLVPELLRSVDGAIVCRNCLDHMRDPFIVMANIARYASRGCRLLLWTDLHHRGGGDDGHRDITSDRDGFRRVVEELGFVIERETPYEPTDPTLHFGCYAVKTRG